MTTLYEIDSELGALLSVLEAYDGEIPDEFAERLDQLAEDRTAKIHGCCCAMQNHLARAAGMQAEIDRLTAMRDAERRRFEWLKVYVKSSMDKASETKLQTPLFKVSVCKSPPSVKCEGDPPTGFARMKTVVELDRAKALADWKAGLTLPGEITIVEGTHLRVT